ncbi:MAG: hypothetical protein K0Q79_2663 [Flavipsychrobacter sp.]|jgi:hypothetical protein|nr:hypothetical protein [Flavipsychrobacter sp.]
MRTRKASYVISEVKAQVKQPFAEWYVGTTEWDDVWTRTKTEMMVFYLVDTEATKDAYEQLVNAGMTGRKPIGDRPHYLYLYHKDGILPDGFLF